MEVGELEKLGCWRQKIEMEREGLLNGERGAAGGGKSGLLKVENRNGKRGCWRVEAENLKWANGKGKGKIWYLYLGFVRAF